jgi:hypothetical protein
MSKLNPQKASAYVGPGVLKQGGKTTPVPNGPLIKKKGPYAGSTLKAGGAIKKAQSGETIKGSRKGRVFKTTKERTTSGGLLEPYKYTTKSIDTTGYSKGKPTYELKSEEGEGDKTFSKSTSTKVKKVPRKQVPSILKDLNKGKNGSKVKKGQEGVKIGNTTYTITNSTKDTIKGNSKYPGIRPPRISTGGGKADKGIANVKKLLKSKAGSMIKKVQTGGTYYASSKGRVGRLSGSKIGDNISAVQNESIDTTGYAKGKKDFTKTINRTFEKPTTQKIKRADIPKVISDLKKGATQKMDLRTPNQKNKAKMKAGGMIKRADGSYSKRGLWDNIRANKGSGKKPTAAMLKQERKIKAKSKK